MWQQLRTLWVIASGFVELGVYMNDVATERNSHVIHDGLLWLIFSFAMCAYLLPLGWIVALIVRAELG